MRNFHTSAYTSQRINGETPVVSKGGQVKVGCVTVSWKQLRGLFFKALNNRRANRYSIDQTLQEAVDFARSGSSSYSTSSGNPMLGNKVNDLKRMVDQLDDLASRARAMADRVEQVAEDLQESIDG